MNKLNDQWLIPDDSPGFQYIIEESEQSIVDGVNILARVVGPAFFLDGVSRNKRLYPEVAWRNAISRPDFLKRLERRLVFGTVGHDQPLDDKAIREGKWSHVVTRVWIDENGQGMAEFLIGNTEPGRSLNTALRMGSRLYVSTRASGDFQRRRVDGNQVVDPETLVLKTIDFVLDPGFLEADPELVESHSEEKPMENNQLTEHLQTELNTVRTERDSALKNLTIAESKLEPFEALGSAEELQEAVSVANQFKQLGLSFDELKGIVENRVDPQIAESLQVYEALGKPEEIQESLATLHRITEEIGTEDSIRESLNSYLSVLRDVGTEPEIREMHGTLERIREELGDEASIREALQRVADIAEEFGTAEEIREKFNLLASIEEEFGTPELIREALTCSANFIQAHLEESRTREAAELAESLGITVEKVLKLQEANMTKAEITETFSGIKPAQAPSSRSKLTGRDVLENKDDGQEQKGEVNESAVTRRLSSLVG